MKYLISLLLSIVVAFNANAQPTAMQAVAPNGAVITLTQETGPCQFGARLAEHLSPDKKTLTKGCWKINDNTVVSIAWFDADGSGIPVKVFKPVETF